MLLPLLLQPLSALKELCVRAIKPFNSNLVCAIGLEHWSPDLQGEEMRITSV